VANAETTRHRRIQLPWFKGGLREVSVAPPNAANKEKVRFTAQNLANQSRCECKLFAEEAFPHPGAAIRA
jgi:hypothetical protein